VQVLKARLASRSKPRHRANRRNATLAAVTALTLAGGLWWSVVGPASAESAGSHASSQQVLIVNGSAAGSVPPLPTQGTVAGAADLTFAAFTFTQTPSSALPTTDLAPFDTLVMYQVQPSDLTTALQDRMKQFVTGGGKLIIHDSDGASGANYDWLPTPATTGTSCPNCGNTAGLATIVESNSMVSSDINDSRHYVNLAELPGSTDAIGDGNVMVTQDPAWFKDITADNGRGQNGAIHTYASAGAGLIVYDGFDDDSIGAPRASGVDWLGKLWYLELAQPWSPDGLPRSSTVLGSGTCIGHGADGWTFATQVSPTDGLVLTQARFGPRIAARRISVPYVDIDANWDGSGTVSTRRAELTPSPAAGHSGKVFGQNVLTSTLVGTSGCKATGTDFVGADATYSVNGLPAGVTLWVQQSYRFEPVTSLCEASEKLPCSRFWPTVQWGVDQGSLKFLRRVRIVQRLDFQPDGGDQTRSEIFRDRSAGAVLTTGSSVETLGRGFLKREAQALAIDDGQRKQNVTWDSWHITDRASTSSPGINPLDPTPGCSECVHMHWSWGKATNLITPGWTDGKPEILDGSTQTAQLTVEQNSNDPDEVDPWATNLGYLKYFHIRDPLTPGRSIAFWDMTSYGTGLPTGGLLFSGRQFPLGDAAWPQLPDRRHGGNGSLFFAPSRVLDTIVPGAPRPRSTTTITPLWPAVQMPSLDLRLPAGWVLPVQVTRQCPNRASSIQGPFWVSVQSTGGATLLNPEGPYNDVPRGLPYTLLRTDKLTSGSTPAFVPGLPVTEMHCTQAGRGRWSSQTFTTYLVFNTEPTPSTVGLRLLGAPDGSDVFNPFREP
jgi:hypothetical protein